MHYALYGDFLRSNNLSDLDDYFGEDHWLKQPNRTTSLTALQTSLHIQPSHLLPQLIVITVIYALKP